MNGASHDHLRPGACSRPAYRPRASPSSCPTVAVGSGKRRVHAVCRRFSTSCIESDGPCGRQAEVGPRLSRH